MKWHPFDYGDRANTGPPEGTEYEPYWIVEEFYSPAWVTIGYFDGYTWFTWGGSDDCSVTHWAEIDYPEVPECQVCHSRPDGTCEECGRTVEIQD